MKTKIEIEIDCLINLKRITNLMRAADMFHINKYAGYVETVSFTLNKKLTKIENALREGYNDKDTELIKILEVRTIQTNKKVKV